MRSVELILDIRCNARCIFCFPGQGPGPRSFTVHDAMRELAAAYGQGAREVYFGGGEPTLRKELEQLVRSAKQIGFTRCVLKTNGMLLCYPSVADRYRAAGVDLFMLPVWGTVELHDRYSQVEGAYEKMEIAVKNLIDSGAAVELDLLVMRSTVTTLLGTIERFTRIGVRQFALWYLSLYGMEGSGQDLRAELPAYSEVAPVLRSIVSLSRKKKAFGLMVSDSDIPPCIDIGPMERMFVGQKDIRIIYPGGDKADPFDGGHKLASCSRCKKNKSCFGVRRDYISVHGTKEFIPVK